MRASVGQVHFEVHVLEGGRWLIDYVTPEEDEAIAEARDLSLRPEIEGVRVIKEIYDPENDTAAGRIVYSRTRCRPQRPVRTRPVIAASPPPRPATVHRPAIRELAPAPAPALVGDVPPRLVFLALGALVTAFVLLAAVLLL